MCWRSLSPPWAAAWAVLVAALELFSLTPLLTADAFGFLLAAAAAGWGGLSVLCQTLAVLEGSGLMGRMLQHETDHLDGHVYLDRLEKTERREALRYMREHAAK